jgi:hypothetical protein
VVKWLACNAKGLNRTLYAWVKNILLFITGVKYVLSTSERDEETSQETSRKRSPMGCAGHSNWMMTRRTLPHLKPVPKTRTPKTGSPWDVATVPTRHLREVIGSCVCYLSRYTMTSWRWSSHTTWGSSSRHKEYKMSRKESFFMMTPF